MYYIDKQSWPRREIFELFGSSDWPFYSVTVPVDVTELQALAKREKLSFYKLMIWACTKALSSVEAFRIRIRGDELAVIDSLTPSFTAAYGEGLFRIVTCEWTADHREFCRKATEKAENQSFFIDYSQESDELVYFSCTPWFDFSSLTNERSFDRDDCIPRLAWGRYHEENGRTMLHLSLDVNHRTTDGWHIAQFLKELENIIKAM